MLGSGSGFCVLLRPIRGAAGKARLGCACVWLVFAVIGLRAADLREMSWQVDGVERTALVAEPRGTDGADAPLVLVFHGHGGGSRQVARSFRLHEHWPQARVVYPQGLPTPGTLSDAEGKRAGWQVRPGAQEDRDLRFFDVLREHFAREPGGEAGQVFATGHSNGGAFVYLLWAERRAALRAIAPSGAVLAAREARLSPLPVLHIAGMADGLVKFSWQERMMDRVLQVNGGGPRVPSAPGETTYPPLSPGGAETVLLLYDGGHRFPADGGARIATFFRAQGSP
jgi:polyhydroxybutyrate depolymerase